MLTNLVDGSDAESVTVAVLQWLNLHLQMLGEDEGDDKDDKDNEDIDAEDDKEKDKNGNDNYVEDEKTFLSPGWASPTWCQSLPRVRSSASIRYLVVSSLLFCVIKTIKSGIWSISNFQVVSRFDNDINHKKNTL